MNTPSLVSEPTQTLESARRLRSLAKRLVRDAHAGEDLIQETHARSLGTGPQGKDERERWMRGVLRNTARELSRSAANRSRREQIAARPEALPSTSEVAERLEAIELVSQTLRALDDPYRSTIVRIYLDEKSPREVARADGVSEGTIRWRVHEGMSRMRRDLDRRFDGVTDSWCLILARLGRRKLGLLSTMAAGLHSLLLLTSSTTLVALLALTASVAVVTWRATRMSEPLVASHIRADQNSSERTASMHLPEGASAQGAVGSSDRRPLTVPGAVQANGEIRETIVARTIDHRGHPLSGVSLSVAHKETVVASTLSDANGKLEVSFTHENEDNYSIGVATWRADLVSFSTNWVSTTGGRLDLGDLVMDSIGAIEGLVLGSDGLPRSDVWVFASLPNNPKVDRVLGNLGYAAESTAGDDDAFGTTDDRGNFSLERVRAGSVEVFAMAEDTLPTSTVVELPNQGRITGVVLRLAPLPARYQISGRINYENGLPAQHAKVRLTLAGQSPDHPRGPAAWDDLKPRDESTSDLDGHFSFRVRDDAKYDIVAEDGGHRLATAAAYGVLPGSKDVLLVLGRSRNVSITVAPPVGGQFFGFTTTVWNAERTRKLCPDASIDNSLSMLVAVPNEPSCVLEVASRGYRNELHGPFEVARVPPSLKIDLVPAPFIRGRITRSNTPIANASIHLSVPHSSRDGHPWPNCSTSSDEDGRYELYVSADIAELNQLVIISVAGAPSRSIVTEEIGAGLDGVNFELTPGGALDVLVHRDSSALGAGRRVLLWPARAKISGNYYYDPMFPGTGMAVKSAIADSDGIASFAGLPAERYRLVLDRMDAYYSGRTVDDGHIYECEVIDGRRVKVEINLADTQFTRADVLLTIDSAPAVGWIGQYLTPSAATEQRAPFGAAADDCGLLRLEAPCRGACTLRLQAPETIANAAWFDVPVQVASDMKPTRLNLITGVVVGTHALGRGQRIRITTEHEAGLRGIAYMTTGDGGAFRAEGVLSGPARIDTVVLDAGVERVVSVGPKVRVPAGDIPLVVHVP